jgi:hypothetical protein
MKQFTIHPDESRPITFNGLIAAEHSTRDHNSNRWTDTTVYLTKAGTYILVIEYHTCWQGEEDRTTYLTFTSTEDLVACLESEYPFAAAEIADALGVHRIIP